MNNMKEGIGLGKRDGLVWGFFSPPVLYTCIPYALKLSGIGCMMS